MPEGLPPKNGMLIMAIVIGAVLVAILALIGSPKYGFGATRCHRPPTTAASADDAGPLIKCLRR